MWTRKMRGLRVSFHGAPQMGAHRLLSGVAAWMMGPIVRADGIVAYTARFGRFVDRFGTRALRRPFTEERAEFMGYFEAVPDSMPER